MVAVYILYGYTNLFSIMSYFFYIFYSDELFCVVDENVCLCPFVCAYVFFIVVSVVISCVHTHDMK